MRNLTQLEVLNMVLNNWHRATPNPRFGPSVLATARFLWLIVVSALVLGLLAVIVQLFPQGEEHCDQAAGTGANVECTQDVQTQGGGKGGGGGHGAKSAVLHGVRA